jgi:ribosome biogenesis ATPase
VDAIMSKRDGNARGMEKRIVAQLLTCMDGLAMENTGNKPVMVIGATNRPDSLDSALRRAGRFDREICMGVPDERARCRILKVMTSKMRLSGDFDFDAIAKKTPGYVGADIRSLTKEAAVIAINRIFKDMLNLNLIGTPTAGNSQSGTSLMSDPPAAAASQVPFQAIPLSPSQLEPLSVTMDDFLQAVKTVQVSRARSGRYRERNCDWSECEEELVGGASERAGGRASERASGRAGERASGRAGGRANERASGRTISFSCARALAQRN